MFASYNPETYDWKIKYQPLKTHKCTLKDVEVFGENLWKYMKAEDV